MCSEKGTEDAPDCLKNQGGCYDGENFSYKMYEDWKLERELSGHLQEIING